MSCSVSSSQTRTCIALPSRHHWNISSIFAPLSWTEAVNTQQATPRVSYIKSFLLRNASRHTLNIAIFLTLTPTWQLITRRMRTFNCGVFLQKEGNQTLPRYQSETCISRVQCSSRKSREITCRFLGDHIWTDCETHTKETAHISPWWADTVPLRAASQWVIMSI